MLLRERVSGLITEENLEVMAWQTSASMVLEKEEEDEEDEEDEEEEEEEETCKLLSSPSESLR